MADTKKGRPARRYAAVPVLVRFPVPLLERIAAYHAQLASQDWRLTSRHDVILYLCERGLQAIEQTPAPFIPAIEAAQNPESLPMPALPPSVAAAPPRVAEGTLRQQELGAIDALMPALMHAAQSQDGALIDELTEAVLPAVAETITPRHTPRQRKDATPQATLDAIVAERRQCEGLSLREFAQHLYDTGIYRATSKKDGTEQPADAAWLKRVLDKAQAQALL